MTESNYYSKDTVDAKLDSIHETLMRVETAVNRTNGRVTALEMENSNRNGSARAWGIVAGAVTSFLLIGLEYLIQHK